MDRFHQSFEQKNRMNFNSALPKIRKSLETEKSACLMKNNSQAIVKLNVLEKLPQWNLLPPFKSISQKVSSEETSLSTQN